MWLVVSRRTTIQSTDEAEYESCQMRADTRCDVKPRKTIGGVMRCANTEDFSQSSDGLLTHLRACRSRPLFVVAAVSAAAGAGLTTAYFASRRNAQPQASPTTLAAPLAPSRTTPPPPSPLPPSTAITALGSGAPVDPVGLFKYGFPGPVADLRPAGSLVSSFDRRTRNPFWVAEHITPLSLASGMADRKHSVFVEDVTVPEPFRAKLKDYFRSGYDRGHQVPAADAKWSQAAMDATFALTNMCPQVGDGFNRDYWAHFEDFCRRLTHTYPSVRIVTGPLYLPKRDSDGKWRVSYEVIGSPPNVAVPTHFYKVIYGEDGRPGGNVALGAFVLPNAVIDNAKPLREFEVPLEIVERAAGLEFASKLPTERRRRLCQEVDCSIIVKDYSSRQQSFSSVALLLLPNSTGENWLLADAAYAAMLRQGSELFCLKEGVAGCPCAKWICRAVLLAHQRKSCWPPSNVMILSGDVCRCTRA
ncbi:hypothetical protein MRB53_039726 [Persea americana]|nr:hypothetical protein MRB53_039726 [Persea americana]